MACANVFNAFATATESLAQDVYKRASYRSMWLNLIERGGNYGWPEVEGTGGGSGFIDPQLVWPVWPGTKSTSRP